MNLGVNLPVYTTRPHGPDRTTASWEMSAWMVLLAMFVAWGNVVGWGIYGLVSLIGKALS